MCGRLGQAVAPCGRPCGGGRTARHRTQAAQRASWFWLRSGCLPLAVGRLRFRLEVPSSDPLKTRRARPAGWARGPLLALPLARRLRFGAGPGPAAASRLAPSALPARIRFANRQGPDPRSCVYGLRDPGKCPCAILYFYYRFAVTLYVCRSVRSLPSLYGRETERAGRAGPERVQTRNAVVHVMKSL